MLNEVAYEQLLNALENALGSAPGGTIVQLMSGYGHVSLRMAKRWGTRVVAIEPDDNVRSEAARRNGYSGLIYMSLVENRIPVQNQEGAVVLAVWCGGRYQNVLALADEAQRVLREGAVLVTVESAVDGLVIPPLVPQTGGVVDSDPMPYSALVDGLMQHRFQVSGESTHALTIASNNDEWTSLREKLIECGLVQPGGARSPVQGPDGGLHEEIRIATFSKR